MMANKAFVFMFADVEVREREFSLVKAGAVLPVEPKAFRVLLMLLRNPQKLIPKEELLNAVWGDAAVTENSLARSIALLRRLLGDETRNPRYIETVATVGYRWVCKVEIAEEPSGAEEVPVAPVELPGESKENESRKLAWVWVLAGGGVLVLCLAGAFWYLHRPLPPPRITGYTRITNDGHKKFIAGTDGNRLYFTRFLPNSLDQIGVAGGEDVQIPAGLPGLFWALDISPDGSNLLVTARETGKTENSMWIVRVLGGASRRIGNSGCATFSPDGNAITCVTSQGDLRLIQTDGTGRQNSPLHARRGALGDLGRWIRPPRGPASLAISRPGMLWRLDC
jgi:DNA-binding winged helix-turn-helix (wHTH) protein